MPIQSEMKTKVLNSIRHLDAKSVQTDTAKGQYSRGQISNSSGNLVQVSSYLEDSNKFDQIQKLSLLLKLT